MGVDAGEMSSGPQLNKTHQSRNMNHEILVGISDLFISFSWLVIVHNQQMSERTRVHPLYQLSTKITSVLVTAQTAIERPAIETILRSTSGPSPQYQL